MKSSGERRAIKVFRKYLVRYESEVKILHNRKFRLDFVIFDDIGIEIDGHSNHFTIKGRIYDFIRDFKILKNSKIKRIYRVSYNKLEKKLIAIIFFERLLFICYLAVFLLFISFLYYRFIN